MNEKLRKIFIFGIIAICVISINLAVFFTFTEKDKNISTKDDVIVDTVELTENFYNIFDNKIDYQGNVISATLKKDESKELVYTVYTNQEQKNDKYELNVNIPRINISNNSINNLNKEIEEIFYKKIESILKENEDKKSVYSVKYKAYINDNILSLVIISNLKEGSNSQREIIKTYNYNISSNQILDINQILNYRELNNNQVQARINNTINQSAQKASAYNELGYNKYIRNINDNMYRVENTKVFFLGEGKALYIVYPYGNTNYTTELDLVVI